MVMNSMLVQSARPMLKESMMDRSSSLNEEKVIKRFDDLIQEETIVQEEIIEDENNEEEEENDEENDNDDDFLHLDMDL